jgi:hypothetical protein
MSLPAPKPVNRAIVQQPPKLYLRGSFSHWASEEAYKLESINPGVYATAASLQQGETVEFMFSGKNSAKKGANCGYLNRKDQIIALNRKVKASCDHIVLENFIFIPPATGVFEFFIDFSQYHAPQVYLRQVY